MSQGGNGFGFFVWRIWSFSSLRFTGIFDIKRSGPLATAFVHPNADGVLERLDAMAPVSQYAIKVPSSSLGGGEGGGRVSTGVAKPFQRWTRFPPRLGKSLNGYYR